LRRSALQWLRGELANIIQQLEKMPDKAWPAIIKQLAHWQRDQDLSGIRDAEALKRLPEHERKEWQQFWAEVEALRKRAESTK
jgi:hypothetical protein